jgi:coenzyme F420-reducing hydrogenase beta subunit
VNESGMIRTQMETHNRMEMVALLGTPCVTVTVNKVCKRTGLLNARKLLLCGNVERN